MTHVPRGQHGANLALSLLLVVVSAGCGTGQVREAAGQSISVGKRAATSVSVLRGENTEVFAPVDAGLALTLQNGYNQPASDSSCQIGSSHDHCLHQKYGLDLVPPKSWDGTILSPVSGKVGWKDDECLGLTLEDQNNLTICHFGSFDVAPGQSVCRGLVLGKASTNKGWWVHLSIDDGKVHRGEGPSSPIAFNGAHKFEGKSLDPGPDTLVNQKFDTLFPITSSTNRVAECAA